jgi:hypothetical protein
MHDVRRVVQNIRFDSWSEAERGMSRGILLEEYQILRLVQGK